MSHKLTAHNYVRLGHSISLAPSDGSNVRLYTWILSRAKAYFIQFICKWVKTEWGAVGSWVEPRQKAWAWLGQSDSRLKTRDGNIPVSQSHQRSIVGQTCHKRVKSGCLVQLYEINMCFDSEFYHSYVKIQKLFLSIFQTFE